MAKKRKRHRERDLATGRFTKLQRRESPIVEARDQDALLTTTDSSTLQPSQEAHHPALPSRPETWG